MGQYFGNVQPVGAGNAFLQSFRQSLAQAKQDALLRRSVQMQDEDRRTATTMQALQLHEQYPGTTLLPTSFRDVGPGTLPNPVDNLQVGKVEPGQPLPVSSGAGMEFGPGYVTDLGERQRVLADRLQQSLASTYAGAAAKSAGEAAGNPLASDVQRSTIAKNLATAARNSRVTPPAPRYEIRNTPQGQVRVDLTSGQVLPLGIGVYAPPVRTAPGEGSAVTRTRKDLRDFQSQQIRAEHDVGAAKTEQGTFLKNNNLDTPSGQRRLQSPATARDSSLVQQAGGYTKQVQDAVQRKQRLTQQADSTLNVLHQLEQKGPDLSALDPHITDDDIREAMQRGAQSEDDVRQYAVDKYGLT